MKPPSTRGRAPLAFAALALLALGSLGATCDDGTFGACTEIGCTDGFQVAFARPGTWGAGTYRVTVTSDGKTGSCEVDLPLSCTASPRCTGETAGWILVQSGCKLDPSQHELDRLVFSGVAPASVEVDVSLGGRRLGTGRFSPQYTTIQPNGPGCEPICRTAPLAELTLAP